MLAGMAAVRVLVVGCGFFGRYHLHAWREAGAEVVGVCDAEAARARTRASEFAIPAWHADAAQAITALRPDVVDIVTTVASHRALVELCARHRVAAICQKPFAASLADAQAMISAMQRAEVPLSVHENWRFQRPVRVLAERLALGHLGVPHAARISLRSHFDVYRAQPYLATDVRFIIADLGVHLLDTARCLLGEVAAVTCITRRVDAAIRGEDCATILLRHASGTASVIEASYATHVEHEIFPQTLIQVDCAAGSLRLDAGHQVVEVGGAGVVRRFDADPPPRSWHEPPGALVQDSVVNLHRHWLEHRAAGTEPETIATSNLRTLALVEAAYVSAAAGATITLEPI